MYLSWKNKRLLLLLLLLKLMSLGISFHILAIQNRQ